MAQKWQNTSRILFQIAHKKMQVIKNLSFEEGMEGEEGNVKVYYSRLYSLSDKQSWNSANSKVIYQSTIAAIINYSPFLSSFPYPLFEACKRTPQPAVKNSPWSSPSSPSTCGPSGKHIFYPHWAWIIAHLWKKFLDYCSDCLTLNILPG